LRRSQAHDMCRRYKTTARVSSQWPS